MLGGAAMEEIVNRDTEATSMSGLRLLPPEEIKIHNVTNQNAIPMHYPTMPL